MASAHLQDVCESDRPRSACNASIPAFAGTGLELQHRLTRRTSTRPRRFHLRRSARGRMGRAISTFTAAASFSSGAPSRENSPQTLLEIPEASRPSPCDSL